MDNQNKDDDLKLLRELLGFEPLACARRTNGDLVYLNPAGQKFIVTPDELARLEQKAREILRRAQEKIAETTDRPRPESAESASSQKPRSHHKKAPG